MNSVIESARLVHRHCLNAPVTEQGLCSGSKTVTHILLELSEYTAANGCVIMPLNSPGGSTLQWATGQRLKCLAWYSIIRIRSVKNSFRYYRLAQKTVGRCNSGMWVTVGVGV